MLQDDVGGQDAASAPVRTMVPGVLHVSSDTPTVIARMRTPVPRPAWEFFQAYPEVLDGDVRRNTLQNMMDVLDAEPKELGTALNNVGVSPVSPTADDGDELENAT